MWKINLNLLAILLLPVCLMAQRKISGKITDSKKRPLPGVNIAIKDTYDGSTSAADGSFSFDTDLKGEQIITATMNGYRPFEQKINLNFILNAAKIMRSAL